VTRAQKLLGFKAAMPLADGLDRTIAWYAANRPTMIARQAA
jgi:nucleoside-diphosphate-sugar epimerase